MTGKLSDSTFKGSDNPKFN